MQNFNRKYKVKLKRQACHELKQFIENLLLVTPLADEDKMHLCLLGDLHEKLHDMLYDVKPVYTLSIKPAYALALRLLYTNYIIEHTSYLGNAMHKVSCEVHQQYTT
jgi:hypothetical protein